MCGIAGLVAMRSAPDSGLLARINAAQAHRGPDGYGIHVDGTLALAHCRLAIIDPAAGNQPYVIDDGRLALTYNGEIYNFVELRHELQSGWSFRTNSDTEVLMAAYDRWGIECIHRFRGMFAFALHDRKARKLHLVRDRLGIKPLYYWADRNVEFAFASEFGALVLHPRIRREVSQVALQEFLTRGCVGDTRTIYSSVNKLAPAHRLELDLVGGMMSTCRYWRPHAAAPGTLPEAKLLEGIDAKLRETVRIYVRSDVPFGSFLSGGVDSSVVTALMARELPAPVEAFSIGFDEAGHSELEFAETAASLLGARLHPRVVRAFDAEGLIDRMAVHFGEPFADSSAIPTFFVSQWASRHVKMVLTGDGGDELFGGYNSYQATFRDATDPLFAARRIVAGTLAPHLPGGRIQRAMANRARSHHEKHLDARRFAGDDTVRNLLAKGKFGPPSIFEGAAPSATNNPLLACQLDDLERYLPDDVLAKVDRMSMANSIETRIPLLDHELVELALSLPEHLRIRREPDGSLTTKYALKMLGERYLPGDFLRRKKQGFGIPVREWLEGPLATMVAERLGDPGNPVYQYLSEPAVSSLIREMRHSSTPPSTILWNVLMFDAWWRNVHSRPHSAGI